MNKYIDKVKSILDNIINTYNYEVISIEDDKIALVNSLNALMLSFSREGIDIEYICKTNNNILSYWITNYIYSKFTDNDRKQYGQASDFIDSIESQLRVISSGLLNNWDEMLKGDTKWIDDYSIHRFGGKPDKVNEKVKYILGKYLK